MTSPDPRDEIDALAAEGANLSDFLRGISAEDWKRPTRCPAFDVRDLVVHMAHMVKRMGEKCGEQFVDVEAEKDRLTWWDYDIEEDQEETARWVAEAGAAYPDGPILGEWESDLNGCVSAVVSCLEQGDPMVRPGDAFIRLSDYVATRVLEVTIHTMDVRDAFGLDPDPSAQGMAVTHGILSGLLGADPRTLGFSDADFAVASTGRRPITGQERDRLGPLADLLPLLA
jgi:uncharacterized protein (TIGR03083 family)